MGAAADLRDQRAVSDDTSAEGTDGAGSQTRKLHAILPVNHLGDVRSQVLGERTKKKTQSDGSCGGEEP